MARPARLRSDLDLLQRLFSAPAGEVPRKLSLRRRTCGQRLQRADLPRRAAYGDRRDEPLPQRHRPTGDTFEPARDSHANRRTIPAQGGKETLREAWNNPGAYRRSSNVRANGRRGGDCEGTAEDCGGTVAGRASIGYIARLLNNAKAKERWAPAPQTLCSFRIDPGLHTVSTNPPPSR